MNRSSSSAPPANTDLPSDIPSPGWPSSPSPLITCSFSPVPAFSRPNTSILFATEQYYASLACAHGVAITPLGLVVIGPDPIALWHDHDFVFIQLGPHDPWQVDPV